MSGTPVFTGGGGAAVGLVGLVVMDGSGPCPGALTVCPVGRLKFILPRAAGADQPGKHLLHELHRPGPHPHAASARLLPLRPAQV